MSSSNNAVREYQKQTRELLVKRALGLLTIDDEAEIAEQLDDIWRGFSGEQQQAVEKWLKDELQPAPNTDVHQDAQDVESDDIMVTPRSAA